jgi:hypothetical protein
MKNHRLLCLALLTVTVLPSCSLLQRWGIARPKLAVLSEERTTIDGETYVTRRYGVVGSAESFSETLHEKAPWASAPGGFQVSPLIRTKQFLY